RAGENGAMYLNYNQLTAVNLPAILSALNVSYTSEQLRLMCSQFRLDSKVEHGACEFIVDPKATGTIPRPTDHELAELYQHLERSERNIIATVGV
ncbi:MAG TPA: hypothetical protein VI750_03960, partial [Pyrinomonadaceae bacterium]|nr:hypothetical protein [Pyrinomonadaceae bacterium]